MTYTLRTAAAALAAAAAGCGAAADEPAPPPKPAPAPSGIVQPGPGAISIAQAETVPLGATTDEVLAELGEPAQPLRREGGQECMGYKAVGQPDEYAVQLCFSRGKLAVVASRIG